MKQSELIKLAEIAGVETWTDSESLICSDGLNRCDMDWRPDYNLDQAFECLDGFEYNISKRNDGPRPTISIVVKKAGHQYAYMSIDDSLATVICKAVLGASE